MKIRTQVAMVLDLDKCIGCHTCSVTCKNTWTNRPGMEYVWFNNVETKPGVGYPKQWENQDLWQGGWNLKGSQLSLRRGSKVKVLANIFANLRLPAIEDYYEPYTFDYLNLTEAPRMKTAPTARPVSYVTGEKIDTVSGSAAWEDNLGGVDLKTVADVNLENVQRDIYAQYKNTFLFYLPRLCEHCLNPACVASCPSGSIYKREEDGIVLVDEDKCKGWRLCMSGCPYKKVYYNWSAGKAEKCIFCYPRIEGGECTVCAHACTGRIRYVGVLLYDADQIKDAAGSYGAEDLYHAQRNLFLDPKDPEVRAQALASGISEDWLDAAVRSPVYKMIADWKIALPLHPEFRTLPMVWYVPPLSPIAEAIDAGKLDKADGVLPEAGALRIPLQYLANLLAAGDEKPVYEALQRLATLREVMRDFNLQSDYEQFLNSEVPVEAIEKLQEGARLKEAGLTPQDISDMHYLLAIANYEDRFVVPTADRNPEADMLMQGEEGFNLGGGEDERRRTKSIFGGPMAGKINPLFENYRRL